ncbi:hypothetical protein RA26_14620 [Leisingera sp. ANG-M7]|nr:hypothetical protein RA26_14620 [Leisingera sp. ANG-M7]
MNEGIQIQFAQPAVKNVGRIMYRGGMLLSQLVMYTEFDCRTVAPYVSSVGLHEMAAWKLVPAGTASASFRRRMWSYTR